MRGGARRRWTGVGGEGGVVQATLLLGRTPPPLLLRRADTARAPTPPHLLLWPEGKENLSTATTTLKSPARL